MSPGWAGGTHSQDFPLLVGFQELGVGESGHSLVHRVSQDPYLGRYLSKQASMNVYTHVCTCIAAKHVWDVLWCACVHVLFLHVDVCLCVSSLFCDFMYKHVCICKLLEVTICIS
jgi:hypothetical protein